MPILIDELLVEADPPPPQPDANAASKGKPPKPTPGDRLADAALAADRHCRLHVD